MLSYILTYTKAAMNN